MMNRRALLKWISGKYVLVEMDGTGSGVALVPMVDPIVSLFNDSGIHTPTQIKTCR